MKQSAPATVAELIDLWSSVELAADLGIEDATVVRMWKYRQSIPAEYDLPIVRAAKRRKFPVDFELLARLRGVVDA